MSCFNDTDSWQKCVENTYRALLDNADFFSTIIDQEGQNSFYQQFLSHTYNYMRGIMTSSLHSQEVPEDLDYALTAHVYGQVNCAAKWIREGFLISPDQMAEYNVQNMPSLIRRFYLDPLNLNYVQGGNF